MLFSFHSFKLLVVDKIMKIEKRIKILNIHHTCFDIQKQLVLNIVILSKYKLFLPVMHV